MDSHPSDAALLLAVADRDLGAFRVLYERHAGWLSVRLARRCNDRDLVADAVQDTFVAIWRKPEGFRGEGVAASRSAASMTSSVMVVKPTSTDSSPFGKCEGDFRARYPGSLAYGLHNAGAGQVLSGRGG